MASTVAVMAGDQSGAIARRSAVYAPHGVVASSQPLASQAGLHVLESGGNAIDAAVTTAVVLNLVEPFMTGIGGDMFAILWSAKEQRLIGINASGRAGSLISREGLLARGFDEMPRKGAESITVPGALSGWAALLERYGTITLAEAFAPTIRLALDGFPVSPVIAEEWSLLAEALLADEAGRKTYLVGGERAPRVGEWFRNPDFAATLRLIAENGPEIFYGGELGGWIAAHVQELGGFITLDDLRDHRAEWVTPIAVPFKGYRLWELPPNGQGIAALEMLRILEPYDLAAMGHNSAKYLHHLIEAKKLAYADLGRYVGDPEYMEVRPDQLLSDAFVAARRARLDPARAAEQPEPGAAMTESDTTYLTAADAEGNMISFINSLAGGFGSGVVAPGTGFALQNRGAGLTLEPGKANTVAPGRRPFHTIIPAFVTRIQPDGSDRPWLSYGVMGGAQQPQAHVQVLLNILLFDMDVQAALDAARFRHWDGRRVSFEDPVDRAVVRRLAAMGHEIEDPANMYDGLQVAFGGGQAIMRAEQGYVAGTDPRRDGVAAAH